MNEFAANGVTISLTTTAIMRLRSNSRAHKSIGRRLDNVVLLDVVAAVVASLRAAHENANHQDAKDSNQFRILG
jgi:hypothetical protein